MYMPDNREAFGYAPPHPGEMLRLEVLPRIDMNAAALASHLGVSRQALRDVLAERRPVDLDMAQRLGQALGNGARFWLALQMHHDVWNAEQIGDVNVEPIRCESRRPASRREAVVALSAALGR